MVASEADPATAAHTPRAPTTPMTTTSPAMDWSWNRPGARRRRQRPLLPPGRRAARNASIRGRQLPAFQHVVHPEAWGVPGVAVAVRGTTAIRPRSGQGMAGEGESEGAGRPYTLR